MHVLTHAFSIIIAPSPSIIQSQGAPAARRSISLSVIQGLTVVTSILVGYNIIILDVIFSYWHELHV
jgi:hypothetical protein